MNLRTFLRTFPVPETIEVPRLGVAFSNHSLRIMSLDKYSGKPESYEEVSLPAGTISAGIIKNEEALLNTLNEVKSIRGANFAGFVIPDEASYVFTTTLPVSPGVDMRESVSFILEENVPLALSEITFDFIPLSMKRVDSGYEATVAVSAAASKVVEQYASVLEKVGLCPVSCMSESQALANAVVADGMGKSALIIQCHKESVGIYITKGQAVEFSSIVRVTKKSELSSLVSLEIDKALHYWQGEGLSQSKGHVDCYVCGEYDMCLELMKTADSFNSVRPRLANVWTNAFSIDKYIPDMSHEEALRHASIIGLLLS